MPDETTNLSLPYILPSQSQKHITHNEALQRLDAVVKLVVKDQLALPPLAPNDGDCYAVLANASGAWTGQTGKIAFYQNLGWIFITPKAGWTAWFVTDGYLRVWNQTAWTIFSALKGHEISRLGINAIADTTTRLSLASASSLLSHEGAGHQLKINKAASAQTASVLFQNAWSGRAEIGLNGNDNLSFKVSPDGTNWLSALEIAPNGVVRSPLRPAVRASYDEVDATRSTGISNGFTVLHVNQGGFTLGNTYSAPAIGKPLIVPVSGLYDISLALSTVGSVGQTMSLSINGVTTNNIARTNNINTTVARALVQLNQGDNLCMISGATATYKFGLGKTELIMTML